MSSPILINLSPDEKSKVVTFLTEKKQSLGRKITSLEREHSILCEFQATLKAIPESYANTLEAKVKSWLMSINDIKLAINKFDNFIICIQSGKAFNPREMPETFSSLKELQIREREVRQLEPKYKYYPRLKKAKEASLHVFSNKIKTIMECENVKVA